jgi:hypothetical protein
MGGKIISRSFQWNQSHLKILSKSSGIVETNRCSESANVLCHQFASPICWALSPSCGLPHLVAPNPRMPSSHKLSSRRLKNLGFVWVFVTLLFEEQTIFIATVRPSSFAMNQAPFLFLTTVSISSFVIKTWTPYLSLLHLSTCSFGWWLMAGADLFWGKSTAGWLLVADLFWEKSNVGWWLISQTNRALI